VAAKGNNTPLVKVLLDKGANPNILNAAGQTVIYVAAEFCVSPALMELVLNAGGNINLPDNVRFCST
jgi:ankyrin repeat protein